MIKNTISANKIEVSKIFDWFAAASKLKALLSIF
jgi:hypothetical protein